LRNRDRSAFRLDIWPGFTDAVSTMLLVLVFVLVLFVVAEVGLVNLLGGKDTLLREMEAQTRELQMLVDAQKGRAAWMDAEVAGLRTRLPQLEVERDEAVDGLGAAERRLTAADARAADLAESLQAYVARLEDLRGQLGRSREDVRLHRESVGKLETLSEELRLDRSRLGKDLEKVERLLAEKGLRISNLLIELERRERDLAELRRVEKYRSEFFAALMEVFSDNPDMKVVGDRFVFQAEVLFPSGSAAIQPGGTAELDKFVRTWKSLQHRIPSSVPINIQIQGHTDLRPITGTYASNWELSTARANGVVEYLIARGLPADMLSAAGFSKYYPAVRGNTAEAYRQNRRIEIRITAR